MNGDRSSFHTAAIRLERALRLEFHGALSEAFRNVDEFQRALRLHANRSIGDFSSELKAMPDILLNVIEGMEAEGTLYDLLTAAYRARPHHPRLIDAIASILEYNEIDTADFFDSAPAETDLYLRERSFEKRRAALLDALQTLVEENQVAEETLARYLRASFPRSVDKVLRGGEESGRAALERLMEFPHNRPFDERGVPALLFANIAYECLDDPRFLDWAEDARHLLGLQYDEDEFMSDLVDPALDWLESPELAEPIYLLVEVTQDGSANLKVQMFWDDAGGNKSGILSCKNEELASLIQDEVSASADIIGDRKLFIEVFLPFELMSIDLEFVKRQDEVLILYHVLVRRILERSRTFSRKTAATLLQTRGLRAWKRRWRRFHRKNRAIRPYHDWIKQEDLDDPFTLKSRLIAEDRICCTTTETDPGEKLEALMKNHVQAGIPIIVWSGSDAGRMREVFRQHLESETTELLPHIWELQRSSLYMPENSICDLHIVYDNPDRLLPRALGSSR